MLNDFSMVSGYMHVSPPMFGLEDDGTYVSFVSPKRVCVICFQVFTNSYRWKAETAKDYRSMRRIVFIVRLVTSRIRARTSIGSCLRVAADQLTTGCKFSRLIRWTRLNVQYSIIISLLDIGFISCSTKHRYIAIIIMFSIL